MQSIAANRILYNFDREQSDRIKVIRPLQSFEMTLYCHLERPFVALAKNGESKDLVIMISRFFDYRFDKLSVH